MTSRLGKIIKNYRKENKLTQFQLAERLGVSEFYISALETGNRQPGRKTLIKLSNEMGLPVEVFLDLKTEYGIKIEIQELYERISALPVEQRKHVINIMDYIIDELSSR